MTWLLLVLGGAAGAAGRYVVDVLVTRWSTPTWPWGTLTVNVAGSAALGLLVGAEPGQRWLALLGVGVCGAFTTVSAFAWQVLALLREGRSGAVSAYVGLSVTLTLAAFALGRLATAS